MSSTIQGDSELGSLKRSILMSRPTGIAQTTIEESDDDDEDDEEEE